MNENHTEILNEFHQLIDTFCEISSTHHEYAGNLSKELNESIEKAIHDEFNTLYELHIEKLTASTGIELYALQTKNGMTIPQRRRRWYTFWKKTPNPAAQQVEEKIYNNAEWFFRDLINRTAAITELAQKEPAQSDTATASEETPANDKPLQQPEAPTEKTPAPPPAPAPQKPAETWEEENAIPSQTLSNPSE